MMTEFKDLPLEGTHGEESRPLFPAYSGDKVCQKSDSKDLAKLVQIPTASPSDLPTASPSDLKTASPSDLKTASPSDLTTASPSDLPTASPSDLTTASPSDLPTASPSDLPNASPSDLPTASLSDLTTASPSDLPTASPSDLPTASRSDLPNASPSDLPTASLSDLTTASPSDLTTASPSDLPTASPSDTVIPLQPWTVVLQKRPKKGTKQKGRPERSRNSRARRKARRLEKQIAIAAETQRELPSTSKVLKAQSVMIPPPHIPSISKVATMVQSVMIPSPYMPSTSKVSAQTQSLVKPPSPEHIPSSFKVPLPTPISKVYTEAQSIMKASPSSEHILSTTKLPPASPEHMPSTSKLPPSPPRPKPISNVSTEAQSVMIPPPPEHIPFSSKLAPTTPISNVSTEAQNVIIPPPPEHVPSTSKLPPPMPISKVSTKAQSVMIPPPTDHMPSTSKLPPPPTLSSQSKRQTPRGHRGRRTALATPEKQPGIVPSKKRPRLETKSPEEAKRTKTTANPKRTVIDQSQLELQIAVTTVPQESLSSSQARQLQDAVEDSILQVVLSPSQTVLAPSFRGRPYLFQGALAMWCENDYTRDWLENALKSIPSPIPDTTLVVVKLSDLKRKIRAGLLLHTFITDAAMIQKVLCSQNPWYQVDTWQCLSMSVKEGDGHRHLPPKYKEVYMTLGIPEEQKQAILDRGRRVSHLSGGGYIRFLGKEEEATNTNREVKNSTESSISAPHQGQSKMEY
ncbi:mucin-5AC-like [Ostrinia nubilalis]|uniref:mucin-5AC-like n=1 Tax=Ostrinia nubilalis TaxID=29057 RepID=UPI00308261AF